MLTGIIVREESDGRHPGPLFYRFRAEICPGKWLRNFAARKWPSSVPGIPKKYLRNPVLLDPFRGHTPFSASESSDF